MELPLLWSKFVVEAQLLPLFFVVLIIEWVFARPQDSSFSKLSKGGVTHYWDLVSAAFFVFGIRRFFSNFFLLGIFAFLMAISPGVPRGLFESTSLWIQIPLALLINDFLVYWSHRFKHASPWLWHTHEFHHSASEVSAFTAFRVHPLDYAVYYVCIFLPMVFLFGPNPVLILAVRWILAVPGYLGHARMDTDLGVFGKIIVSPRFHHLHHEKNPHQCTNFSNGFVIWDWLFGTYTAPDRSIHAIQPGIESNTYDGRVSWRSYVAPVIGFYKYPFVKLKEWLDVVTRGRSAN